MDRVKFYTEKVIGVTKDNNLIVKLFDGNILEVSAKYCSIDIPEYIGLRYSFTEQDILSEYEHKNG